MLCRLQALVRPQVLRGRNTTPALLRARRYGSTPKNPNMTAGTQAKDWLNTEMPLNTGLDAKTAGTTPTKHNVGTHGLCDGYPPWRIHQYLAKATAPFSCDPRFYQLLFFTSLPRGIPLTTNLPDLTYKAVASEQHPTGLTGGRAVGIRLLVSLRNPQYPGLASSLKTWASSKTDENHEKSRPGQDMACRQGLWGLSTSTRTRKMCSSTSRRATNMHGDAQAWRPRELRGRQKATTAGFKR